MEDDISDPTASLASLLLTVISSVAFGVVIGIGFALAIQLNTLGKQFTGTWVMIAGLFGFLIVGFIVIIRSERYRAKRQQTSFI